MLLATRRAENAKNAKKEAAAAGVGGGGGRVHVPKAGRSRLRFRPDTAGS